MNKPIKLHFTPFNFNQKQHAVEKSDQSGARHRYLCGIASGLKEDAHGERISSNCIESLIRQASSGDVLLYSDVHGIKASEDIGILTKFNVFDDGSWYVEFRLYDESDKVDQTSLERADKIWRQSLGLSPYRKPRQKGFSIEGYVPEDKVSMREERQVIDDMVLEGVVVVPKPAYEDSVIHAVYKALGEEAPWVVRKGIRARLREAIDDREAKDAYDSRRWEIDGAKDCLIQEAMEAKGPDLKERLEATFDEYKELMTELLMDSTALFDEASPDAEPDEASPYSVGPSKGELFRRLRAELDRWAAIYEGGEDEQED